jgi:hypothetical protein
MDSGVAISAVLIFFMYVASLYCPRPLGLTRFFASLRLQYPKNGTIGLNTIQAWWGELKFIPAIDS